MNRKELRHDRHTVSLLMDHMVFAPKYRGKMLVGDVAMICEGIICKTCVEMGIQVIEIAVNPDHVHIFFKYPPKYSLSYIAKKIKGVSSRKNIFVSNMYMSIIEINKKNDSYRPRTFVRGIP